ncbi:MAG TPA: PQQ-dependent sugar dehydrogenase [Patescibacteria group bacterium]|nr:PQQ-dependent sugar dehydrogenase [Patescibacteria group bacterium]
MNKKTEGVVLLLICLAVGLYYVSTRLFLPAQNLTLHTVQTQSPTSNNKPERGGALPFPLTVPSNLHIGLFASGLGSARDLQFSPSGTLLVSDPSHNRVLALPDANHDGQADSQKVVVSGGDVVHGLAFHNGQLYVAEKNSLELYSWNEKTLTTSHLKTVMTYPGTQDHTARTLVFGTDNRIYLNLGSNCNVCVEKNPLNGTVITAKADGGDLHTFAKGQRNAPFLAVNPMTKEIWTTGMGRDYLGDNTPPDEINILHSGDDYGWPYCYGDKIHDDSFDPQHTHSCQKTIPPIYQIPAHSAPLGLAFIPDNFYNSWQNDLVVAYHGSWNRSIPIGYKVVLLHIAGNTITGSTDLVSGFLTGNTVHGRPVDVAFDENGNLFISDDKTGNIYIVSSSQQ